MVAYGEVFIIPRCDEEENVSKISKIEQLSREKIVQIAGTNCSHTLALSNRGHIFSWGRGRFGELGLGSNKLTDTPTKIQDLRDVKIVRIFANGSIDQGMSFAITSSNETYCWGNNNSGQLGLSSFGWKINPIKNSYNNIKELALGEYHTIAMLNNGIVLVWGSNVSGQLE
jgi:alpha-tubulin suppressor-like RCC1 family protein